MIVSELCSNGDLFDYIRNVDPPTLYRAVCLFVIIAVNIADKSRSSVLCLILRRVWSISILANHRSFTEIASHPIS